MTGLVRASSVSALRQPRFRLHGLNRETLGPRAEGIEQGQGNGRSARRGSRSPAVSSRTSSARPRALRSAVTDPAQISGTASHRRSITQNCPARRRRARVRSAAQRGDRDRGAASRQLLAGFARSLRRGRHDRVAHRRPGTGRRTARDLADVDDGATGTRRSRCRKSPPSSTWI